MSRRLVRHDLCACCIHYARAEATAISLARQTDGVDFPAWQQPITRVKGRRSAFPVCAGACPFLFFFLFSFSLDPHLFGSGLFSSCPGNWNTDSRGVQFPPEIDQRDGLVDLFGGFTPLVKFPRARSWLLWGVFHPCED